MNKLSLLAAASLAKNSDDPAIEFEGRWYSWNDVNALANKLGGLIDNCGGATNGPIVFIARSQAASIAAFLALIRTGRTIRMIYPFQSSAGIMRDIRMMQPSIVVARSGKLNRHTSCRFAPRPTDRNSNKWHDRQAKTFCGEA
jgi:long-chain acyl-CoA synthetase